MKLHIENVGKIKNADVELNGITVICGENNTGKSTIGKVLFCIFNSCYKIDDEILKQLSFYTFKTIENKVRSYVRNKLKQNSFETINFKNSNPWIDRININELIDLFTSLSQDKTIGINQIKQYLMSNIKPEYSDFLKQDTTLDDIYTLIQNTFSASIEPYRKSRIKNFFFTVFDNQLVNTHNEIASICAEIQNKQFSITFNSDDISDLKLDFNFNNKSISIDSPDSYKMDLSDWEFTKNEHTLWSLVHDSLELKLNDTEDIDRVNIENILLSVNQTINKAISGKFVRSNTNSGAEFQFKNVDGLIHLENLSTGIKVFLLFQTICKNGMLSKKDILILDEPEIHLHPEWQLVYAEAIVLLQKELDLTVLITTHSPYFVEALDKYSKKYNRKEALDFYLSDNDNNGDSKIENVTNELNKIYKKLYRPLQTLENLEDNL